MQLLGLDYFGPTHHQDYRLLSKSSILQKFQIGDGIAFLFRVVTTGKHEWRFKLKQYVNEGTFTIGIFKTINPLTEGWCGLESEYLQGKAYGYMISDGTTTKGDDNKKRIYGKKCVTGDVIDMILDLSELELRYRVNNTDYGAAFKVKRTSYIAAVSFYSPDDFIQLVSYTTDNIINGGDDVKCEQCDQLTKTVNKLKEGKNSLQQRITELENDGNAKENLIKELKEQNKELQQKCDKINESNIKLNEECKELQTDLQEIALNYSKLCRKLNIDESNYMSWDSDDVTDWIISLDQEYTEYEHTLRENLKEERVDGSLLGELDKNDLHRIGIKALKHKIAIIKHINRLKTKQLLENSEGNNATAYI